MLLDGRLWADLWIINSSGSLRAHCQVWEFLASESPLKMMKNAFYFNVQALFVLKIFKFLSWLFSHAGNSLCRKKRLISKLMASQSGKHTITIHITPDISKSKGNQAMKSDKHFSWKIIHKRSYSQLFLKHQNWAYLCIIVWIFIQFVLLYLQVDEYQNILKPKCWPLAFTFYKSFFFLEKHDFLRGYLLLSPPPPLFVFDRFRDLLPPKVRLFWLELTLSPSISMLVKFREKKLVMNISIFGWAQRVF